MLTSLRLESVFVTILRRCYQYLPLKYEGTFVSVLNQPPHDRWMSRYTIHALYTQGMSTTKPFWYNTCRASKPVWTVWRTYWNFHRSGPEHPSSKFITAVWIIGLTFEKFQVSLLFDLMAEDTTLKCDMGWWRTRSRTDLSGANMSLMMTTLPHFVLVNLFWVAFRISCLSGTQSHTTPPHFTHIHLWCSDYLYTSKLVRIHFKDSRQFPSLPLNFQSLLVTWCTYLLTCYLSCSFLLTYLLTYLLHGA